MGIKATFSQASLSKYLKDQLQIIDDAIVLELNKLGVECVNHARENGNYTDRTGNLRASIGYVIVVRGKTVKTVFPDDTKLGSKKGKQLAASLASQSKGGYSLIVVAGMNYANAVESRNYDVIGSAELVAMRDLPKAKARILRMINKAAA